MKFLTGLDLSGNIQYNMTKCNIGADKTIIRKETIERLKKQDSDERRRKSLSIKKKLFSLNEFKQAKCVMFYVSTETEVETGTMIDRALEMGKRTAVPFSKDRKANIIASEVFDRKTDLEKGPFGIYQSKKECLREVPLKNIDLVVVPGIMFDKDGFRLGRGKGHYDRFLKDLPPEKKTVGLAFDFQLVERLPKDSHDIPVSKVITNQDSK